MTRFLEGCCTLTVILIACTACETPTGMTGDMGDDMINNDFVAEVTGGQEVPPVDTTATGTGTFKLNDLGTAIDVNISATGLSGPATAMHFHEAATGVNGNVVVDLSSLIVNGDGGSMTAVGTVDVSATNAASIRAGTIYLNIHTDANPAGEIRGQLTEETNTAE